MATRFAGNGLSRTAMVFRLATMAGHTLTVPELNRIKEVNPRSLERVYDEVIKMGGGRKRPLRAESDIEVR